MAFLCPARRKRSKVKIKGSRPLDAPLPGRLTGSDSVDTLIRVGIEKEQGVRTRMVVLHDFYPCVDDELAVKRGQEVSVLYQENDWMYVIAENGKEGFVPYTYCLPVQRSVDDFVSAPNEKRVSKKSQAEKQPSFKGQHSRQQQQPDHHHQQEKNDPPAYQFATIGKNNKPLNRSSSKSLPDISTINPVTAPNVEMRYPQDGGSSKGIHNPAYNDAKDLTYGMSRNFQQNGTQRRPRSLSYDRQRANENRASTYSNHGTHSQPVSPSKTPMNSLHLNTFGGSERLSSSNPVTPNTIHNYTANAYSSMRVNGGVGGQNILPHNKNRQSSESGKPVYEPNRSWGPRSGQELAHQLKNANLSATYPNQQNTLPVATPHHQNYRQQNSYMNTRFPPPYSMASNIANHNSVSSNTQNKMTSFSANHNAQSNNYNVHRNYTQGTIQATRNTSNQVKSSDHLRHSHIEQFKKSTHGEYLVLFNFAAQQENDIGVERGEFVTVLNKEDKDWFWIRRSDNQEGFVPGNYLLCVDGQINSSPHVSPNTNKNFSATAVSRMNSRVQSTLTSGSTMQSNHQTVNQRPSYLPHQRTTANTPPQQQNHTQISPSSQTSRDSGRLICVYDYQAQSPDDLTVTRGEWLYTNTLHDESEWIWVYSPSQSKAGYIPRTYAKIPAV